MSNHDKTTQIPDDKPNGQFIELKGDSSRDLGTTKPIETVSNESAQQIDSYRLLQQIGEGGMGSVWMAEQKKPVRRRVALKLVRSDQGSKEIIARFESERQALAMMDHQNIAKILDAGTTTYGSPYFVMELVVKGMPITDYCDQNKLSIPERLELFLPVCRAIQHAHQKGIIHRDLKPSNVLVARYDGRPIPKVIDFGLAKALEHTLKLTDKTMFTQFGQLVGTVQYMSPEQAELNTLDVDIRTDIYSLGVMLYELLTGTTPLEKNSIGNKGLLQVLSSIREKDPPRPSDRLSSSEKVIEGISEERKISPSKLQQILRGELDWVVMKALEKEPARRYQSANALYDDVRRYLDGKIVRARPPSFAYRIKKRTLLLLRNPVFAGVFAFVVTVVILLPLAVFLFDRNDQSINTNVGEQISTPDLPDLIAEAEKSLVKLEVDSQDGNALGSGFVVSSDGMVVTTSSVMDGAIKAYASFPDNEKFEISGYKFVDEARDICIVQLKNATGLKPLKLAQKIPRQGEPVTGLGSPLGLSFSATSGIVSAVSSGEELGKEIVAELQGTWLQVDVPLSPGSAGGPLINSVGEVVAMSSRSGKLSCCISAIDISGALAIATKTGEMPLSARATKFGDQESNSFNKNPGLNLDAGTTNEKYRIWVNDSGKFTIEARLVERVGDRVRLLRRDGTAIMVPINRLSDECQEFLKQQ